MPRRCSTLNGNNGEATNTDDIKKGVNQLQNRRLAKIEATLRSLSLAKKVKRKQRKAKSTRRRETERPSGSTFSAVPDVGFDSAPPLQKASPIQASIISQVAPFRVPRCMASCLTSARPSQKISARALGSFSLATTERLILNLSPCIASDLVSMFGYISQSTGGNQVWSTGTLTAGNRGTSATTNSPYTQSTLSNGDNRWRLVSAGLRLRNTTAPVSRSGVVRYLVDYSYDLLNYDNLDSATINAIVADVNASHKTVRVNSSTHPTIEIALHNTRNDDWSSRVDVLGCYYSGMDNGANGTVPVITTQFYPGPVWVHIDYPATAQTYDIELIEHWEVSGSNIETLHTPSPSHAMAANTIRAIAEHSHHQHALQPHLSFASVVKGAVQLEHNKEAMRDASIVGTALAML